MRRIEKGVLLETLDFLWREHLILLEQLRQAVGLRGYGQRDPLNEYKSEAFTLFETMLSRLRSATTKHLMNIEMAPGEEYVMEHDELPEMFVHHVNPLTGEDEFGAREGGNAAIGADGRSAARKANGRGKSMPARHRNAAAERDPNNPETWGKVARNAACPCGSGKKFKHCHGALKG